jgi:hypothetical protein
LFKVLAISEADREGVAHYNLTIGFAYRHSLGCIQDHMKKGKPRLAGREGEGGVQREMGEEGGEEFLEGEADR